MEASEDLSVTMMMKPQPSSSTRVIHMKENLTKDSNTLLMLSSASPSINTLMSDDYVKSNSYLTSNPSHINSSITTMNDSKTSFVFLFSVVANNNPKILLSLIF